MTPTRGHPSWLSVLRNPRPELVAEPLELEGRDSTPRDVKRASGCAVREVIVLGADLDHDQVGALDIAHRSGTGDDSVDLGTAVLRSRRSDLAEATAALTHEPTAIARDLGARGWSVRDDAPMLGISPQRVSQVTRTGDLRTPVEWARSDSNRRPADYESGALTD